MPTPSCTFCTIVEQPANALIVHEDARTIAFLSRHPEVDGHTLLVPKPHHADIFSIPEDLLAALMTSCKRLALHWREHVGAAGVNILHASGAAAEQSIFHFHVHLFPRFPNDGLHAWPSLPRPTRTREDMHAAFRLER